jgi:hypothetical protein
VSSSLPKTSLASLTLLLAISSSSSFCFQCHGHLLVRLVDVLNGENGKISVVTKISEGDSGAGLQLELVDGSLVNIEVDGHGEECAIGQTVVLDNAGGLN